MDRSISPPRYEEPHHSEFTPPWENRVIGKVPYIVTSNPARSDQQGHGHQPPWSHSQDNYGRHFSSNASRKEPRPANSCPVSPEDFANPWIREMPQTARYPIHAIPAPYETPTFVPPAPRTAGSVPQYVYPRTAFQRSVRAPPSPPESLTTSGAHSTTSSPSPKPRPPTSSLPDTMSTRGYSVSRTSTKSSASREVKGRHAKTESMGKVRRFRTALKGIFTTSTYEDDEFETIEDRHWTDE